MDEFEELKGRVERWAEIAREFGANSLDPRVFGSSQELSQTVIDEGSRQIDRRERDFVRSLQAHKLPRDKARTRCLECNEWNPPATINCGKCKKRMYSSMTDVEKREWSQSHGR